MSPSGLAGKDKEDMEEEDKEEEEEDRDGTPSSHTRVALSVKSRS